LRALSELCPPKQDTQKKTYLIILRRNRGTDKKTLFPMVSVGSGEGKDVGWDEIKKMWDAHFKKLLRFILPYHPKLVYVRVFINLMIIWG